MKRQDLKNGMVVEVKNGTRYLVCGDKFIRDYGYLNIEDYSNELKHVLYCDNDFDIMTVYEEVYNLDEIKNTNRAIWRRQSLLDSVEKEYLEFVLRPFKDKIEYIVMTKDLNGNTYLYIALENDSMQFPSFEKGTMYKGLGVDKRYTVKELGLWEDTH